MDLALNNLQRLICHKTKPNQTKLINSFMKTTACFPSGLLLQSRHGFSHFLALDSIWVFATYP